MKAYRVKKDGLVIVISEGEWVTYEDDILFIDHIGDIMVTGNSYRYQKRPCFRLCKMYYNQVSLNYDASVANKWVWKDIDIIDIEFIYCGKRYTFDSIPIDLIEFDIAWDRNIKLEKII